MKKFLLLCLALLPAGLFAQNRVTGRLVDGNTSSPEVGAVVQLLEGESVKAYALTDSLGVFLLENRALKTGTQYILAIDNLGRKSIRRELTLGGEPVELGDIPLEDDLQALESSKVVSARKLIKMDVDKVTYDVSEDVDAKATTVLEMLRKVPMVTVDGQDNITVNGSSSFKVYVDGKPNEMLSANPSKVFKAMPASSVKNIEVITNPGAKYDAEGTGGVLNLITVRNSDGSSAIPDGVNGSLNIGASSQWSVDGGLYLQARKKKFSFGMNINGAYQDVRGGSGETTQTTGDITTRFENDAMRQRVPFTFAQVNASYEADTLNLVSASLGFDFWAFGMSAPGQTAAMRGDIPLYSYTSVSSQRGTYYGINAGVDYQHTFRSDSQRMLTLSYRFGFDPEKGNSYTEYGDLSSIVLHPRRVITDDGSSSHTFQADFTTPIVNPKHTLSTGVKFIYRFNKADDLYRQFDETAAEETVLSEERVNYRHYNYIAAAYAEYAGTVGKFGLKAGLRYEHTIQKAIENGTRWPLIHYPSVVPNASVQWNFAPTQNIGLAYNMRIRRPGISFLSPFVNRSSTTSISYGNPDLRPSLDHSLKLEYHYFSQKVVVNVGADYRYGQGGISQYSFYGEDPDDPTVMILQSTYGNIVDSHRVGLNYFISWNPWKDTRIYSRADGGYETFLAKKLDQSNHGWNGFLMVGVQQTIPWDIRISANFFGSSRRYSLQGWNGGFMGLSMAISKSFLDDRLSITLQGFTNFNKGPARFKNHSEGKDFTLDSVMRFPIRNIGLNLSWNFGKKGIQTTSVKHTITNDDVMSGERGGSQTSAAQGGM
jgi:hypothetical protein